MPDELRRSALNRYAYRHGLPMAAGTMNAHSPSDEARQLAPGLRRLRAPNPGRMTGDGTNTYIVGVQEIVVIDPGPAIESHIERLLRLCEGRIAWILVTHTHLDHSPGARILAASSGGCVAGAAVPPQGRQDSTFAPDRILADNDLISTSDATLRAVHTPGHASNHLCYSIDETRTVFTGDHINQGSTVVIDPPDGDMAEYMASLRKLSALRPATLMPGHGEPITSPDTAIDALLAHRTRREAKIYEALRSDQALAVEALLPQAYDDVEAGLHAIAARSLLAHLLKLAADGRVYRRDDGWLRA